MSNGCIFQPTRPLRGATSLISVVDSAASYFNPRAPCGARPKQFPGDPRESLFQPTRPLRGATMGFGGGFDEDTNFNPRAPCGARQATASARANQGDFNPRAPCGARPRCISFAPCSNYFNPRAPCGARPPLPPPNPLPPTFQPTRPLRGATVAVADAVDGFFISTHAPLAGRDLSHRSWRGNT